MAFSNDGHYIISKWRIWLSFREGWATSVCEWRSFLSFSEWGSFSSFCKWRSYIPIKENKPQAEAHTLKIFPIRHRKQSRGRSEPPADNGAIFVQRIAPLFCPWRTRRHGLSCFVTKILPHFRTGDQAASGADSSLWNCSVRKFKMVEARCDKQRIGKTGAPWECSWRKLIGSPTAVYLLPNSRIRRRLLGPRAVRYENIIFVTRSWRRFCGAVSERTSHRLLFWRKSPLFSLGRPEGGSSEMSCETRLAVRSLVFFHSLPACNIDEWSHLWSEWPIGSAGIPLPLLWEYVRCHIGMTVLFTAHHSSVCLSVFYAEFACPMDMTNSHIESTPPTLISIW